MWVVILTLALLALFPTAAGVRAKLEDVDPAFEDDLKRMVSEHFNAVTGGTGNHPNRQPVERLLRMMQGKPLHVIETGSAAWGLDSTRLFDNYIRKYGGFLHSVDLRKEAGDKLIAKGGPMGNRTHLHVKDSMAWLKEDVVGAIRSSYPHLDRENVELDIKAMYKKVDIWFLDSFDVDWESPDRASFHGFCEVMALMNPKFTVDQDADLDKAIDQAVKSIKDEGIMLRAGSYIWIDDTPKNEKVWERVQGGAWHNMHRGTDGKSVSYLDQKATKEHMKVSNGVFPGKGSFAMDWILNAFPKKFKQVYHEYSVIYKVL